MERLVKTYPLTSLAAGVLTVGFVSDMSLFKKVKPLVGPVALAAITVRVRRAKTSALDILLAVLPSACSPRLTFVLKDVTGLFVLYTLVRSSRWLRRLSFREIKAAVGDYVFGILRNLGPVQKKLKEEATKLEESVEHSLRPHGTVDPIKVLPVKGRAAQDIIKQLQSFAAGEEGRWKEGLVSGSVYGGEADLVELMGQASALYSLSNPLHPDLFPSVMKFEAEICSMVANMVNGGDKGVVGALTSGGTESILLAAKTHRDFYREEHGVTEPEIVACVTAHAAIDKACNLMGIRLVKVPMEPKTFKVDVAAMERAITSNTIMLYSSAPTFGQGVIDPIEQLSKIALKHGVGLHVDCCLGGFVLPFAKKLGWDIPTFDFALPGVTSMSVDTHKYGYASKGTSVVVYRSKELRRFQYFCFPSWPGGLYVTPTVAGSRPGALSAACWAAMVHIGEEGYMSRVQQIMQTTQAIAAGCANIPGLYIQGEVKAMIVSVASDEFCIYDVGDLMAKKFHWSLNSLQSPAGLHLCVTMRHVGKEEKFLSDLRQCVNEVRAALEEQKRSGQKVKTDGNAAIYGMASTLPAGPINEMLKTYTDVVLKA